MSRLDVVAAIVVCLFALPSQAQSWGSKSGSPTGASGGGPWGRTGTSGTWGTSKSNGWGTQSPNGWGTGRNSSGWPRSSTGYEYRLVPRYEWVTEGAAGSTTSPDGTTVATDSATRYRKIVGYDRVRTPVGTPAKPGSGWNSTGDSANAPSPGALNQLPPRVIVGQPSPPRVTHSHRPQLPRPSVSASPALKTNAVPSLESTPLAANTLPLKKPAVLQANPAPVFRLSTDEDWRSSSAYQNQAGMRADSFGTMSDMGPDAENDVVEVIDFGSPPEEEEESDEEDAEQEEGEQDASEATDSRPNRPDRDETEPINTETSNTHSTADLPAGSGAADGTESVGGKPQSGGGKPGQTLGNEAKPGEALGNEVKPEEALGNPAKPEAPLGNDAATDAPSKPGTENPGWPSSGTDDSPWSSSDVGTSKPSSGGNTNPPDHWLPSVKNPPHPVTGTGTTSYNPWDSNRPGLKGGDWIVEPLPPTPDHSPAFDPDTGLSRNDTGVLGIGAALGHEHERPSVVPAPNLAPGDVQYQQALPPVQDPPPPQPYQGSMKVKVTADDAGTQLLNDAAEAVFGVDPMQTMEAVGQTLVNGIEQAASWLPKRSPDVSTDQPPVSSSLSGGREDRPNSSADDDRRSAEEQAAALKRRQQRDAEFRQSERGKEFHNTHGDKPTDPAAAREWKKEQRQAMQEHHYQKAAEEWEQSSDSEAFTRQYGPRPTDPVELERWEKRRDRAIRDYTNPIKLEPSVSEGGIRH